MANLSNINGKFVVEQTTGFVGVGTTDPGFLIEAAGTNAELALNASSIYRIRSTASDEFIITKNGVGDRLTISGGGDATFAGKIGVAGKTPTYGITLAQGTGVNNKIAWTDGTPSFRASMWANSSDDKFKIATANSSSVETVALEIDISQNATFAGNVILGDTPQIQLGTGNDAQIDHTGSHLFIDNSVGNSYLRNTSTGSIIIRNSTGGDIQFDNEFAGNILFNTSNITRLTINSSGNATFAGTISSGDITIEDTNPNLTLSDTSTTNLIHEIKSASDKLQISADSNNVDAGTKIEFYTDGVERLEIGSNGNIDFTANLLPTAENAYNIGSASLRWEDLYVDDGYIRNAYIDEYIYHNGDADTYIRVLPDEWIFRTGGSDRFTISSANTYFTNTNVGIGTSSPSYKLEVAGTVGINSNLTMSTSAEIRSSDGTGIRLRNAANSANEGGFVRSGLWEGDSSRDPSLFAEGGLGLRFYTGGSASERMYIDSSGNVGIGTGSPNHKLDIYSNENVPLRIHRPSNANLDSSGAWGIGFSTRGDAITSTTDTRAGIFSYYNGNLFFATNTSSIVADPDASARMTITSAGNVGIGTTSPGQKLEVDGNVKGVTAMFNVLNNSANSANIIYRSGTTTIVGGGSSSNKLYVLDNGDVGVNDSSPSYKLDADGTIRATGDVIAYSDRRVKENIKTIDNALDKVLKLRGVSYNRKDIDDKSTKIGVIAQEVLETIPEVVEKDLEDKYSVAYGNMAGLFIEAIKELKAEIEELKKHSCDCKK